MARTMIHSRNGHGTTDARKRAAILDRIERRDEREIRDMLRHIAGTDAASLRAEYQS